MRPWPLSTSRDCSLKAIVSYGSAAKSRYWYAWWRKKGRGWGTGRDVSVGGQACTRGAGAHDDTDPAGRLHFLFVGGHEPVARDDVLGDLGVVDLEQQALLPCDRVADLRKTKEVRRVSGRRVVGRSETAARRRNGAGRSPHLGGAEAGAADLDNLFDQRRAAREHCRRRHLRVPRFATKPPLLPRGQRGGHARWVPHEARTWPPSQRAPPGCSGASCPACARGSCPRSCAASSTDGIRTSPGGSEVGGRTGAGAGANGRGGGGEGGGKREGEREREQRRVDEYVCARIGPPPCLRAGWVRTLRKYGSLLRSIVSSASLRRRSRRSAFACDSEATPPPPFFDPTRFWKSIVEGSARVDKESAREERERRECARGTKSARGEESARREESAHGATKRAGATDEEDSERSRWR